MTLPSPCGRSFFARTSPSVTFHPFPSSGSTHHRPRVARIMAWNCLWVSAVHFLVKLCTSTTTASLELERKEAIWSSPAEADRWVRSKLCTNQKCSGVLGTRKWEETFRFPEFTYYVPV